MIRYFIARLTRLAPHQPGGGIEASLTNLLSDISLKGHFSKYHYAPKDGPFTLKLHADDVLIHLVRDPLENIVSWTFSYLYRKQKQIDISKNQENASQMIQSSNKFLLDHIKEHKDNQQYVDTHGSSNIHIQFEDALEDPEYLVALLQQTFRIEDEAIEYFKTNFDLLKQQMMTIKSSPDDSIRLNTAGDSYYWRNLLSTEDIALFDKLYRET